MIAAQQPTLLAYNQQQVTALLRDGTPRQLLHDLRAGQWGERLSSEQRAELDGLLEDWRRRALDEVTLRDALLVDPERGERIYMLLCHASTVGCCALPPDVVGLLSPTATGSATLAAPQLRATLAEHALLSDECSALLEQAEVHGLALIWHTEAGPGYPPPANLEQLLSPLPAPYSDPPRFEQPTGLRRVLAVVLAALGVGVLGVPLLLGYQPVQPAGLSLGLLTLALLVGIRARWPGYLGAALIWLVPNLPGFHYDTPLASLPAVPLLLLGLILLACDQRVRGLWSWLFRRGR